MAKQVVFLVENIDLDDDAIDEARSTVSPALWVERDGVVTVTYTVIGPDVVAEAVKFAMEIESTIPGAAVTGWYADLVSVAQIAQRVGVSAEAVRLWTVAGRGPGGFPVPMGRVGGGAKTSPVWRWADVAFWLKQSMHFQLDDELPSRHEIALLEAHLTGPRAIPGDITYSPAIGTNWWSSVRPSSGGTRYAYVGKLRGSSPVKVTS